MLPSSGTRLKEEPRGAERRAQRGEGSRRALPVSEEDKVLLTGGLWQEMAWTEMSFSITLTLTGVRSGDSAGTNAGYHTSPAPITGM